MNLPFCDLKMIPEKLLDKNMKDFDVVKYAILLDNGFEEDEFSTKVKAEAEKAQKEFLKDLKNFKVKNEKWGSKH
tara:strand:+ start:1198 stop:1422 length:225 start_codon:yes stop_codon:yes gene_type:complete